MLRLAILAFCAGCASNCPDFEPGTYRFEWTVRSGTCIPPENRVEVLMEPPAITVPPGCLFEGIAECGVTDVRLECPSAGGGAVIVEQMSEMDVPGRYVGTQMVQELAADGTRICTSEFGLVITRL